MMIICVNNSFISVKSYMKILFTFTDAEMSAVLRIVVLCIYETSIFLR
jgi:hypothetical protein